MADDLAAWVALSLLPRIGSKTMRALLDHFGDVNAVLNADADELQRVYGVGPKTAEAIQNCDISQISQNIPNWLNAGVEILVYESLDFPNRLKSLDDFPCTLFQVGKYIPNDAHAVAVVGTRNPSLAGVTIARRLGAALARKGITVVSGLALGVDRAAHMGAVENGGRTVGVLGSGILRPYPERNRALIAQIVADGVGAVFSEVHPLASPVAPNLVARNRIITGLSTAVIVVESSVDGGAMHAARFAKEQGRFVYAVQNDASGNLALLENGAQPIPLDFDTLPF